MQNLTKGGNAALPSAAVTIRLAATGADVSAYLLGADGRVRSDGDMIFFNQPSSSDGSIRLEGSTLHADLPRIPAGVDRIAVCAVPETGNVGGMGKIGFGVDGCAQFSENTAGMTEAAVIVCELYRRQGAWKVRAVAQGFDGGLAPLSRHFGVEVDEEPTAGPAPAPTPVIAPKPVSLTKVTLTKQKPSVSLSKGNGAIRANLTWGGRDDEGEGDLDFYCFYVDRNGVCGKVYWNNQGRRDVAPFITLSGDSQEAGSEEIVIHRPEDLRFAMFAAYSAVSNGTGSFASFQPKVTLTDQAGNEVTIPLLNSNETSYWVAISHIAVADRITISTIESYGVSAGLFGKKAQDAERAPRLHADGKWDVSKGEIEFKS